MVNALTTNQPVARYYGMTVSSTAVGFPSERLIARGGLKVNTAIGRVETAGVRIGMLGIITPTTTVGVPVAKDEFLRIDGYDNLTRFLAIKSGETDAAITWFLMADQV